MSNQRQGKVVTMRMTQDEQRVAEQLLAMGQAESLSDLMRSLLRVRAQEMGLDPGVTVRARCNTHVRVLQQEFAARRVKRKKPKETAAKKSRRR